MEMKEFETTPRSGGPMLFLGIGGMLVSIGGIVFGGVTTEGGQLGLGVPILVASILSLITFFIVLFGLIVVEPNAAKVLLFFGKYVGTVKKDGWYWVNPFNTKKAISLRVNNFETDRLKVNDIDGNPIEIATIVVWKVVETAEASFAVEDYRHYVRVQSESAVRNLATHYPYDSHEDEAISLRGHTDTVADKLRDEISDRLKDAGVEVLEARLSHLAYAQEIAQAMLQRQQAGAIIAARQKIVEGAVGMVEMALTQLSDHGVVELDPEQRAAMVSNLLVVLCGDRATQPVVNAGSIYK